MPRTKKSLFPLPLFLLLVLAVAGGTVAFFFLGSGEDVASSTPLWTVERGPLKVTVVEGGTLEALDSYTVVSRVEGANAILSIVDEGTVITPDDVAKGKVLVQLDTANLDDDIERQKIEVASAHSAYENAVSNLVIQRQENASDIRKAELDVRFARLDLARYVGRDLVDELVLAHREDMSAPDPLLPSGGGDAPGATDQESANAESVGEPAEATPAPVTEVAKTSDAASPGKAPPADHAAETAEDPAAALADAPGATHLHDAIQKLLQDERLQGEAQQTSRQLESDIRLAEEEEKRAQVTYDWSKQLESKGFASREELEADRIALERRKIELERAKTAQEQFVLYDFPKEVEQLLSNLVEAEDQLSRTRKRAESAEAKAVAESSARREQDTLQAARLAKLTEQRKACTIRAERTGLVVYASSQRRSRHDQGERIQEGATIRERQAIITIPNLAELGVKSDIHESVVERVHVGEPATVVVDALPDHPIHGKVVSVAPLPNAAENWLNPDLKVYSTSIRLDEVPPNLRPGMNAKIEILVADLQDVVLVPVQAVTGNAGQPVVYVEGPEGPRPRPVELGLSNDRFVQIQSGVDVGEEVLLSPPVQNQLSGARRGNARPAGRARPGRGSSGGEAGSRSGREGAPASRGSAGRSGHRSGERGSGGESGDGASAPDEGGRRRRSPAGAPGAPDADARPAGERGPASRETQGGGKAAAPAAEGR